MHDPELRIFEFRAVKQERSRLQRHLEMAELDLRLETVRTGSPHILRLTKTHAAYDRALEERKQRKRAETRRVLGRVALIAGSSEVWW